MLGGWLDLMILEVFSNLWFCDPMILCVFRVRFEVFHFFYRRVYTWKGSIQLCETTNLKQKRNGTIGVLQLLEKKEQQLDLLITASYSVFFLVILRNINKTKEFGWSQKTCWISSGAASGFHRKEVFTYCYSYVSLRICSWHKVGCWYGGGSWHYTERCGWPLRNKY